MDGNANQREYLIQMQKGLERIADITASLSRMNNPVYQKINIFE
jgi:hypothetical protein